MLPPTCVTFTFSGPISQSDVSILFMHLFMCLLLTSIALVGIIFESTMLLILTPLPINDTPCESPMKGTLLIFKEKPL